MTAAEHERRRPRWFGLPFMSRDLMDQRRRQREVLRLVASDILDEVVSQLGDPVDASPDARLVETNFVDTPTSCEARVSSTAIWHRRPA